MSASKATAPLQTKLLAAPVGKRVTGSNRMIGSNHVTSCNRVTGCNRGTDSNRVTGPAPTA